MKIKQKIIKPSFHDYQMKETYKDIYKDYYSFKTHEIQNALKIIKKNLKESKIALPAIKKIKVINIGTGREAVAFHNLGVNKVFHFDVSEISVNKIKKLQKNNNIYSNIQTQKTDICLPQKLLKNENANFVYFNGVLHHLYNPKQAIENIHQALAPGGKIFLRIYRSGSLAFFVVDFIRKFIRFHDRKVVNNVFKKQFTFRSAKNRQIFSDLNDDFFVPVLKLFCPKALKIFFLKNKYKLIFLNQSYPYNHSDNSIDGQGISLIFQKVGNNKTIKGEFPESIDQNFGIIYKEKLLKKLCKIMKECLPFIQKASKYKRAKLAVVLYKVSQLMRINKKINKTKKWSEILNLVKQFS